MMLKASTASNVVALFALFFSPVHGAVNLEAAPQLLVIDGTGTMASPSVKQEKHLEAQQQPVPSRQYQASVQLHPAGEVQPSNAASLTEQKISEVPEANQPGTEEATMAQPNAAPTWQVFAGTACLPIGIVVFLYWSKGPSAVTQIIIYLLALAAMKGAVRLVEHQGSFKFPLFLTGMHFVSGALVAFAILMRNSFVTGENIAKPSLEGFTTRFGPIAAAFALSVAMNNMALVHSTSAFVEMVGASTPLVSVVVVLIMGKPFHMMLLGPVLLVFLGCALTSQGELFFSFTGLALAAGANVPRAVKGVFQQLLLQTDANASTYTPLEVLAWTCLPSSLIMLSWSLVQEGIEPYRQWHQQGLASQLTAAVLFSCVNACILNTAVLFVIRHLGAVGTQIVAQIKSILTIVGGMCFLNEQVSKLEFAGFSLVMLGVYTFNALESRLKKKSEEEQQLLTVASQQFRINGNRDSSDP